jgi:hypothetical protein
MNTGWTKSGTVIEGKHITCDSVCSKRIQKGEQYKSQPKPQYHEQNEDRSQPITKIK